MVSKRKPKQYQIGVIPPDAEMVSYAAMIEPRIRQIRERQGMSQRQLAELVGTSQPQIDRLEKGDRGLDLTWMFKIAKALKCHPSELLPVPEGDRDLKVLRVPVIGDVQAGVFREALEWPLEEQYEVDFEPAPRTADLPHFGLKVVGPSMNRVFPEASTAICVRLLDLGEDYEIQPGRYVVVYRRNELGEIEATIKQYEIDANGTAWLWPRSDHPAFQAPIEVRGLTDNNHDDANDDVQIWAVVVGQSIQYPL